MIINSSLPDFNLKVMEAALKVGCNYQDMCSYLSDNINPEQLTYDRKFEREGLLGLINTGVGPGLTNLLAREGYDELDNVESIKIRFVEDQKTSEMIFAWSPEVTMDALTSPPLIYRNGKFVLTKPFGDYERYKYPLPFGERNAIIIYGDEVATIPRYLDVRNVDAKSTGTDVEFSKALYRLGLFNKKPVKINGKSIAPIDLFKKLLPRVPTPREMRRLVDDGVIEDAEFGLVVDAIGYEDGKKILVKNYIIFPTLRMIHKKFPGATYISYPTGVTAYAFSRIIKKVKERGVIPPECLEKDIRKEVLLELESKGIVVNREYEKP